jgi:hypothetical protein
MLHSISWQSFLTFIVVSAGTYYFFVILIYYKREISRLLKGKTFSTPPENGTELFSSAQKGGTSNNPIDLFSLAHELLEELKQVFSAALREGYPRQELIVALQILLRNYKKLKQSDVQSEINNHIETQSKETCSITLSAAEIQRLWNG